MPAPDEHAAEAEELLADVQLRRERAEAQGGRAWPLELVVQEANVHALLASRPTTPDNESEMGRDECGFCSGGPVVNDICPWHGDPKSVADELQVRREHFDGPDRMELVRELREAVGLSTAASSMPPRQAWLEALDRARLATRPGPAGELVRRAVAAETAELRAENERLQRLHQAYEVEATNQYTDLADLRERLKDLVEALENGWPDQYDRESESPVVPALRKARHLLAETRYSFPSESSEPEPVPSTGEDQDLPDSARARAGMTVIHKSGSRHVLSHRKGDDSGWWLADKGGVADWILDSDDWQLIFEPVPDEGSKTDARVGSDWAALVQLAGEKVYWGPQGGPHLLAGKDGAQGWVPVPVGHWIVRMPSDDSDYWPVDPDYFASKYVAVPSGEGGDHGG